MKEFIAWVMIALAGIGALYALALIVYYFTLPKDANGFLCSCDECERCDD